MVKFVLLVLGLLGLHFILHCFPTLYHPDSYPMMIGGHIITWGWFLFVSGGLALAYLIFKH